MKILILIGDGPESEDELSMYSCSTKVVSTPKVYTTLPINPAKNFDDWMKHIYSLSQSLSREWRTHYNVH